MPNKIKYPVVDGKKECGVCGEWKPITEYDRARKHYVSQCKDCKRVYSAEYRQRPESKKKSAEYHKLYMQNGLNRQKKNEYLRQWRKLDHTKESRNLIRKKWMVKEKQKAITYKGGRCVICGYNQCLAALDFHHIVPSEKGFIKDYQSFKVKKNELDKCILVCVRCHREIHAGVTIYE
jgi:hypothetical protein